MRKYLVIGAVVLVTGGAVVGMVAAVQALAPSGGTFAPPRQDAPEPDLVAPAPSAPRPAPAPGRPKPVAPPPDPFPTTGPSLALGIPSDGALQGGRRLATRGRGWFAWDPIFDRAPNRWWRRYGHPTLLATISRVLREFAAAHPGAPLIPIGDLSLPRGGFFGARYGGLGHQSHQNGLDVDVYYPRRDRKQTGPTTPRQVDRALSQDLVNRFVAVGAEYVFVGPALGLRGPKGVVFPLRFHDDHLHLRIHDPDAPVANESALVKRTRDYRRLAGSRGR